MCRGWPAGSRAGSSRIKWTQSVGHAKSGDESRRPGFPAISGWPPVSRSPVNRRRPLGEHQVANLVAAAAAKKKETRSNLARLFAVRLEVRRVAGAEEASDESAESTFAKTTRQKGTAQSGVPPVWRHLAGPSRVVSQGRSPEAKPAKGVALRTRPLFRLLREDARSHSPFGVFCVRAEPVNSTGCELVSWLGFAVQTPVAAPSFNNRNASPLSQSRRPTQARFIRRSDDDSQNELWSTRADETSFQTRIGE